MFFNLLKNCLAIVQWYASYTESEFANLEFGGKNERNKKIKKKK